MLPTAAFALGLSCSGSQPKFTKSNFFKKQFFFSLKVKLQGMRHLAGQRHQEQTELGQRHLVLHPLLAARGGPGGMRRLQVKWEAPLLWLVQVEWHLLGLLPCRCKPQPQVRWPWHQSRCKHIAGRERLMKETDTCQMMSWILFSLRKDTRYFLCEEFKLFLLCHYQYFCKNEHWLLMIYFQILEPPPGYQPIRTPTRKLTATPTPVGGSGFYIQVQLYALIVAFVKWNASA